MTQEELDRMMRVIRQNAERSVRRAAERVCAAQGGSVEDRVRQFEQARLK